MELNLEQLKTITILYVEDGYQLRESTTAVLNKLFKKVYMASDAFEALDIFTQNSKEIDVVVTDINMPDKNGIELAKEILSYGYMPIIFATAYSNEEYLQASINLGIDYYVTKPIKIKTLAEQILNCVAKHREEIKLNNIVNILAEKTKEYKNTNRQLNQLIEDTASELNLLKALANTYIISIQIDKNALIKDISNKFIKIFEYSKNEIIGKQLSIIEDKNENISKIQKTLLEVIYTKKSIQICHNFATKNGATLNMNMMIQPHYDDKQYIDGYTLYLDFA